VAGRRRRAAFRLLGAAQRDALLQPEHAAVEAGARAVGAGAARHLVVEGDGELGPPRRHAAHVVRRRGAAAPEPRVEREARGARLAAAAARRAARRVADEQHGRAVAEAAVLAQCHAGGGRGGGSG
jgi:hypothetical protein